VSERELRQVGEAGARFGLTIQRSDIVDALATLIQEGLARAYLLSSREPSRELQGMPPLDVIETNFETYFYLTKKGIDMLSKDQWRPFDD
jgi:hypothetical protein